MTNRFPGRVALCVSGALALAACREARVAPRVTPVADDLAEVVLAVSDSAPSVGDTIRLTAVLRLRGDTVAASFTGRLRFDTLALAYAGDVPMQDGALHASNPVRDELRVAGATLKGFGSGALFSARFIVREPRGLSTMRFTLDELHELRTRDISASVRPTSRVVQERP